MPGPCQEHGAEIDVHHFSNYLNRLMGDDDALWQRAEALEWRGLRDLSFHRRPTICFCRWCMACAGRKDEAADWTIDASASIDSGLVDWSIFVKETRLRMIEAVCAAGLRYLKNALKKPIPPEVLDDLDATTTPQHLTEFCWYASSPTPRNFAEMASALEMSKLRLPAKRIVSGSELQGTMSIEAGKRKLLTAKLAVPAEDDFVANLRFVVRLKTDLPKGTPIVGGIRIMGFVLDRSRLFVGEDEAGSGVCQFVFNASMPLLKLRGVKNVLFVAGVDADLG